MLRFIMMHKADKNSEADIPPAGRTDDAIHDDVQG
jgi:hypothetical protein